jgi:hypothetical protein
VTGEGSSCGTDNDHGIERHGIKPSASRSTFRYYTMIGPNGRAGRG